MKKGWHIVRFRVILIEHILQYYGNGRKQEEKGMSKEVVKWILAFAAAVIFAALIQKFVLLNIKIPTASMENTICAGDRLFGFRLSYRNKEPQRGDIIIFKSPDNETMDYVKRVIGLPGETVDIRDAHVYIDGADTPLTEDYLKEEWTKDTGPYTFEVPEGSYFVMGDNRNNSYDARNWDNTFVVKDKILGKAFLRYYPLSAAGFLE